MLLNASHEFLPKTSSAHAAVVMDHFGIGFESGRHTIAENLPVPIAPGRIVLFSGPSGSGKSTLMRAAAEQWANERPLDIDALPLPDRLLIDALDLPLSEALSLLAACGLGEARLLLRTPAELSDGQRYRFKLALALSRKPAWILADEFTATLDRTLTKVVAFNIHRLSERTGTGFLLAGTHEDIVDDLSPHVHVRCRLDGPPEVHTNPPQDTAPQKKKRLSLLGELDITTGQKRDWPHFAGWHYRSHNLGIVRFVTLLWHRDEPIGICVFTSAPLALRQRNRFFGVSPKRTRTGLRVLDRQIVHLSRVVLHPTWRGAGVASAFVWRSCVACPWPWIETLTEMGRLNPFFEKAGFVRVGATHKKNTSRRGHSALFGAPNRHGKKPIVTEETFQKSRRSAPIYYIFDNRAAASDLPAD